MNTVQEHQLLEKHFKSFFQSRGYNYLESVPVTSGLDPSVYLINSATNLFKPFLGRKYVRVFAIQPSMRTQILKNYYCREVETEYPTCFDSYGVYVSMEYVSKLVLDSIELFLTLGFCPKQMRVRTSGKDEILLGPVHDSVLRHRIELDTRTEKYDHAYGCSLTGRAIKIDCYQEWQKKYKNLCYIILIFKGGMPQGAELATSDQLILMRAFNHQYGVSVSRIADLLSMDTFEQRRFADSVAGASRMLYEGLRPNSSNTNGRTLKKYLKAVLWFGNKLDFSVEKCVNIVCEYIRLEYNIQVNSAEIDGYFMRLEGVEKNEEQ